MKGFITKIGFILSLTVFGLASFVDLPKSQAMVHERNELVVHANILVSDFEHGNPDQEIVFFGNLVRGATVEIHLPISMLWEIYRGTPTVPPLPTTTQEVQVRLERSGPTGPIFVNTGGILNSFDLPALPRSDNPELRGVYAIDAHVNFTYFKNERETATFNKVIFSLTEGAWVSSEPAVETVEGEKTFISGFISLNELEGEDPAGIVVLENEPTSDPYGPGYRFIVPLNKLKEGGLNITDRIPSEPGSVDFVQKVCVSDMGIKLIWASDLSRTDASNGIIEFTLTKITRVASAPPDVRSILLQGKLKYSYPKAKGRYYPIVEFNRMGTAEFPSCGGEEGPALGRRHRPGWHYSPAGEGAEIDSGVSGLAQENHSTLSEGDGTKRAFLGGGGGGWTCSMAVNNSTATLDLASILFILGSLGSLAFRKRCI